MARIVSTLIEAHLFRRVDNDIEFLLLKRSPKEFYPNIWQMVTGSIQEDEQAYKTALREIHEETALKPKKLWVVPRVNSFYNTREDEVCMVPVFAALVGADDRVIISEEHSEFKWLKMEEAKKLLAWPGQRESLEIIYNYFTSELSLLNFVEIQF